MKPYKNNNPYRLWRIAHGLTLKEIAETLGVSVMSVSLFERYEMTSRKMKENYDKIIVKYSLNNERGNEKMNAVERAIRRLNYRIDKLKKAGLYNDISGSLEINFGDYITKSGRISKTLAKSGDGELLERLDAMTDYLKGIESEYNEIPENIYEIWQNVIHDYYRFISEFGADALSEIAPITTENIRSLSKEDEKKDFWKAVETWRREREKILKYADEMRNAEPFTDF